MYAVLYFIGLLGPPAALALAIPKLTRSLFVTTLATWASASVATHWFLKRDGDPIATLLWFFLLVLPCATTIPAALVATRLVRPRAQLIPTIAMALLGLVLALCVLLALAYVGRTARADDLIAAAIFAAMPAVYSASGAAYATHLGSRRV